MHIAVYLDTPDNCITVCFQPAIEVMKPDPRHSPGSPVVKLCRDGFG